LGLLLTRSVLTHLEVPLTVEITNVSTYCTH